jgi:hypothetical protein
MVFARCCLYLYQPCAQVLFALQRPTLDHKEFSVQYPVYGMPAVKLGTSAIAKLPARPDYPAVYAEFILSQPAQHHHHAHLTKQNARLITGRLCASGPQCPMGT